MKKALVIVLAVTLVFGFSTLAMADGHEYPTEDNTEKALEALWDIPLWGVMDDTGHAAKAVNVYRTVEAQELVKDTQELPSE